VSLPDGKDWLMRPVLAGMCRYESLKDGTLDLFDLAEMNEALSVKEENTRRANRAISDANKRR
jgi:hypothetical protein